MRKKHLIELGKTLLIILLTISALSLSNASDLTAKILGAGTSRNDSIDIADGHISQLAKPLSIVVNSAENAHYGVKYSDKAIGEAYADFTAELGEALGSAGEPTEVTEKQWQVVLGHSGIFLDYIYAQPISGLAKWLGVEIGDTASMHTARRICLAVEGNSVALYYQNDSDEIFYRCDTALSSDSFVKLVDKYVPNGAMFGFEVENISSSIDPYYVILSELSPISNLVSENSVATMDSQKLLEVFQMEEIVSNNYSETDGTKVYIEGEKSVRIAPDGQLQFNNLDNIKHGGETLGVTEILSLASQLIAGLPISNDVQLSFIDYDEQTGEYTVRFEYVYDGIVIAYAGRNSAIELRFLADGEIEYADIMCRSYVPINSAIIMPERQAMALIMAKGGGEPLLAYTDYGDNIEFEWTILN